MRVIEQYAYNITPYNENAILKRIEECGRVCYKSEDKISDTSAKRFVKNIIRRGHESVLEHGSLTVKFVTDRSTTHEIVRHRIASYSQESQRYCNYSKDKFNSEVTFIKPVGLEEGTYSYRRWKSACEFAENAYFDLLGEGCSPEIARDVLPNSCKTELVMTANIREWRHFIRLRNSEAAHPQMRELARKLCDDFVINLPTLFEDLQEGM